jgi:hypothetical protein
MFFKKPFPMKINFFSICLSFFVPCLFPLQAQNPQQGWTFDPEKDEFTDDALLDLSYLNEDVAGENGFVQLGPDGEDFVTENGGEIRFWATGGGNQIRDLSDVEATYFAKFLAKKGVNMIRFHGEIHATTDDMMKPNTDEIDAIWRMVAVMKEEGIYSTISPYWPRFLDGIPEAWELGDYSGTNKDPWGLLFFNERYQEAFKSWLTYLYTETNPYTGIPLKDDPAVGLIQIQNEDGVFFWTIQSVEPSLRRTMERQFYDWLINKYDNIDAAYAFWNGLSPLEDDNPAAQRMGIYQIFEATVPQSVGKDARVSDQIAFFADVQAGFYREVYDHLREIGCQQLINATNWKTASAAHLLDAERATNAVADVMAVNRYFDPGHAGENRGWRVDSGHQYVGESVLFQPHKLPVNVKQVSGKPFMMTESSWPFPHKYLAESVFLTAAYASLTGFDAYYWFSPRSPGYSDEAHEVYHVWENDPENFQPIYKFNNATPGHLSPFPANALLYRKSYIEESRPLVYEERSMQQVYGREIPLITEESGFDPNRESYDQQGDATATKVAPLAYLAGKVRVKYDGDPDNSFVSGELGSLINFSEKVIRSVTGELSWDYEEGRATVDAPAAQGVTGFIAKEGETISLSDVTLNVGNEYVAVMAVSLDGRPLSSSGEVLVQVNTLYETSGYQEKAATFELNDETVEGFEVVRTGQLPWKAANTDLSLTISNDQLRSAHLLDVNGYEVREIAVEAEQGQLSLKLPSDALYVVINTEKSTFTSNRQTPEQTIIVYPNPGNGEVRVKMEEFSAQVDELRLHDMQGREIYRETVGRAEGHALRTRLSSGLYHLSLYFRDGLVKKQKLIVK